MEFIKKFFDIKFLKFIAVGLVNTLVGNGLQFVLLNATALSSQGNSGVWIASSTSYVLASILSYFLNKKFTFKNQEKGIKPILKFSLNIAVCYLIAYGLAIPLTSHICISNNITMFNMSVESFSSNASLVVGSCLFVALNYIGQRYFAFKEKNN